MPSVCVWRQSRPCEPVQYSILSLTPGACWALPVGGSLAINPFQTALPKGVDGGQVILARAVACALLRLYDPSIADMFGKEFAESLLDVTRKYMISNILVCLKGWSISTLWLCIGFHIIFKIGFDNPKL